MSAPYFNSFFRFNFHSSSIKWVVLHRILDKLCHVRTFNGCLAEENCRNHEQYRQEVIHVLHTTSHVEGLGQTIK